MLTAKNNIVYHVYKRLFIYQEEDAGFSKATAFINKFKNELGFDFDPIETTSTVAGKGVTSIITIYQWQLEKKTVTIDFTKNIYKKSNGSFGGITIKDAAVLLPNND